MGLHRLHGYKFRQRPLTLLVVAGILQLLRIPVTDHGQTEATSGSQQERTCLRIAKVLGDVGQWKMSVCSTADDYEKVCTSNKICLLEVEICKLVTCERAN